MPRHNLSHNSRIFVKVVIECGFRTVTVEKFVSIKMSCERFISTRLKQRLNVLFEAIKTRVARSTFRVMSHLLDSTIAVLQYSPTGALRNAAKELTRAMPNRKSTRGADYTAGSGGTTSCATG